MLWDSKEQLSKRSITFIALAITAGICGIVIGRYFGFSQFTSVGIGVLSALLLAFPVVKSHGRLSFTQWAFTIVCVGIGAALIHLVIGE